MAFLRGCGLPDDLITYLPSLLKQAIQFCACFISYSTRDQEFVEKLHADLPDKGVRSWYAPRDLKIGDRFREPFKRLGQLEGNLGIPLLAATQWGVAEKAALGC